MPKKSLRGNSQTFVVREGTARLGQKYWDSLPWKPIDVTSENLGKFDDAVFFGLEELDGNAYLDNKLKESTKSKSKSDKKAKGKVESVTTEDVIEAVEVTPSTTNESKKSKGKKRKLIESSHAEDSSSQDVEQDNKKKKTQKKQKNKKSPVYEDTFYDDDEEDEFVFEPATTTFHMDDIQLVEQGDDNGSDYLENTKEKGKKKNKKQQKNQTKSTTEEENSISDLPSKEVKQLQLLKQKEDKQRQYQEAEEELLNELIYQTSYWDNIELIDILQKTLLKLDFQHPTPIQAKSIPMILNNDEKIEIGGENCDIVGIAETGSGKTLAYVLPIINSIIANWKYCNSCKTPFGVIIAPTRELAMQISSVIKDISKHLLSFNYTLKITSVTIVGGMSEEKQRRLLSTSKQPLHIIIATPGRFAEILNDDYIEAFQDMSQIKYLIVDEADRIMEEGHFAELHRVFSRIRDHEQIVAKGQKVVEVLRRRREGVPLEETESENEKAEGEDGEGEIDLPEMPTEEEIEAARQAYENGDGEAMKIEEQDQEEREEVEEEEEQVSWALRRQTLLFTATGLENAQNKKTLEKSYLNANTNGGHKKISKLKGTVKGLANDCSLPLAIKELLSLVAIQSSIRVVDVTHDNRGQVTMSSEGNDEEETNADDASLPSKASMKSGNELLVALPKHLLQFEVKVPTEDKDIYTYYYLLRNEGRTLIFVNSIKTARRLDGLLRALQFHCRTIHADLPQRTRIKALETFQSSPRGILVATDVAARGLDIPKISSVIHYDIARSPQVYIHRSGRTARANNSGKTISLVTPEDTAHHTAIVEYLTGKKETIRATKDSYTSGIKTTGSGSGNSGSAAASPIQPFKIQLSVMPMLRERVRIAKKIFTQNFILSQNTKEKNWITENAEKAGITLDDYMLQEIDHLDFIPANASSAERRTEDDSGSALASASGADAGISGSRRGGTMKGDDSNSRPSHHEAHLEEVKKTLFLLKQQLHLLLELSIDDPKAQSLLLANSQYLSTNTTNSKSVAKSYEKMFNALQTYVYAKQGKNLGATAVVATGKGGKKMKGNQHHGGKAVSAAAASVFDWRKRKNGFFVYNPNTMSTM